MDAETRDDMVLTRAQRVCLLGTIVDHDLGGRRYIIGHQRTTDGLMRAGYAEYPMEGYFKHNGRRLVRLTSAGEAERKRLGGN